MVVTAVRSELQSESRQTAHSGFTGLPRATNLSATECSTLAHRRPPMAIRAVDVQLWSVVTGHFMMPTLPLSLHCFHPPLPPLRRRDTDDTDETEASGDRERDG